MSLSRAPLLAARSFFCNNDLTMEDKDQNRRSFLKPIVLSVLFFFLGFYFGAGQVSEISKVSGLEGKEHTTEITADFSSFWRVWNLIDEKYVPPDLETRDKTISGQERVWGAIKGMVRSLGDPNTTFLTPKELEVFEEEISGAFEGVGMEVGIRDGVLTVIAPLKNTPAYRAGIKAGDKIFKIDDKETLNLGIEEAISLIRGKKGTPVSLILFREDSNEPVEITLIRDTIDIPTLDTEWRDDIFIIRLYNFSGNAQGVFRNALREFILGSRVGERKLILDLRGNPGGFLNASVDIASWFLPAGKVVIKEDFGGRREDIVHRSRGYNIFGNDLEMVVLIDKGSASASEILAGALQEHGVATIVGNQSFGKGSVQELVRVTPDTSLKVTVARWVTPNGKSISLGGLEPDIEVEIESEDLESEHDLVLEKAIEILKN